MNRQVDSSTKGYALIAAMIVLAVTAGLVLGFMNQVNTQQKIGYNDGDYSTAFYAAEAGLEKLNSDLSKQFYVTVYPSNNQLTTIQDASYYAEYRRHHLYDLFLNRRTAGAPVRGNNGRSHNGNGETALRDGLPADISWLMRST